MKRLSITVIMLMVGSTVIFGMSQIARADAIDSTCDYYSTNLTNGYSPTLACLGSNFLSVSRTLYGITSLIKEYSVSTGLYVLIDDMALGLVNGQSEVCETVSNISGVGLQYLSFTPVTFEVNARPRVQLRTNSSCDFSPDVVFWGDSEVSSTIGYFHWADHSDVSDFSTRIISFDPQDGEVIDIGGMATGTVDFDIHVYINDDDIGDFLSIKIIFRNIDHNTLASGECTPLDFSIFCSNYSFDIFRGIATTSGDFYYSSSTVLKAGNYRVEASIDTATNFLGINLGFFTFLGGISDVQNHQFVVGSSTWIGNMSQTIFSGVDEFFGTLPGNMSATSSAKMCMPFRNNVATAFLNIGNSTSTDDFSPMGCLGFLFIPDSNQMKNTLEQFRVGVLQRAPWGYASRLVYILNSSATTSLPVISYTFPDGGGLDGATWNIDPGEMIAGAGTFLNSVEDRNGNNIRDVLEPLVKLVISIALIFGIVTDLTGSHGKSVHSDNKNT